MPSSLLPNSFFVWQPFSPIPWPTPALDLALLQTSTISLSLPCSVIFIVILKTLYYLFIYSLSLPVERQLHKVKESVSLIPGMYLAHNSLSKNAF